MRLVAGHGRVSSASGQYPCTSGPGPWITQVWEHENSPNEPHIIFHRIHPQISFLGMIIICKGYLQGKKLEFLSLLQESFTLLIRLAIPSMYLVTTLEGIALRGTQGSSESGPLDPAACVPAAFAVSPMPDRSLGIHGFVVGKS